MGFDHVCHLIKSSIKPFGLYGIWSRDQPDLYLHTHPKMVSYLLINQDYFYEIIKTVRRCTITMLLCCIYIYDLLFTAWHLNVCEHEGRGRNKFKNLCPIPLIQYSIKYVQTNMKSLISISFMIVISMKIRINC